MAGNKEFPKQLDQCIKKLQTGNYQVSIFRSAEPGDLSVGLNDVTSDYDAVVVAGGDGSINEVINTLLERQLDLPLGIIPAGTANDFASQLKIPSTVEQAVDIIKEEKIQTIDVGRVNEHYFINVCAAGLLANVSHQIDTNLKNTLGKLGYYIKGLEQLPNFKNIPLKISTPQQIITEEFYLFLVLNDQGAGGFKQLAPQGKINDGVFDFIGIKACPLAQIASLFVKILQGRHLEDQNIIHLQAPQFKIEIRNNKLDDYHSDLDGEKGPGFPLDIEVIPKGLKVFTGV